VRRPARRLLLFALVACAGFAMAACGGSAAAPSGSAASEAPAPSAQPHSLQVIGWSEAADRVGETVAVEGPVVSVDHGTGPTGPAYLLNIGLAAPDPSRFVAVIPDARAKKFSQSPAAAFDGALVRVTGRVVSFGGVAAIVVRSPKDIKAIQP
jgi:DNA/RNA endonuclease YhcR with UshA esterase domain